MSKTVSKIVQLKNQLPGQVQNPITDYYRSMLFVKQIRKM
jgi:hypothetical protein